MNVTTIGASYQFIYVFGSDLCRIMLDSRFYISSAQLGRPLVSKYNIK